MRKRLTDIPVGPKVGDQDGFSSHDYSHVLPSRLKNDGYKLVVLHGKGHSAAQGMSPGDGLHSVLYHPSKGEVGSISGSVNHGRMNGVYGAHAKVRNSTLEPEHQGKGLGLAMYQAFYAHAKNGLGATHASSEENHSTMASRVHQKLAQMHGLEYQPKKNPAATTSYVGPYDAKMGPYSYALKSEVLAKSEDEVLRMLAIPEERSLALKMGACQDGHLAVALQHEDLRDAIMGHKGMGPITRHAILSNQSLQTMWAPMLEGSLSVDQLDTLRQTCQGMDCEDDITSSIVSHPNVGAKVLNPLIDLGYSGALASKAVDKWTLDTLVHWHVEQPENPIIAEMARAALANPATSEHCYELALALDDAATQMAVLQAKYYLPIKPATDILLGCIYDEDALLRLAVVEHPLVTKDLLEIAAQDKDCKIRELAKQKLLPLLKEAGLSPEEITNQLRPEIHKRP